QKTVRVKDKWREKKWVTVLLPTSFDKKPIAYIPVTDDENAIGRVIEVTLHDILKGDPSQHQFKLYFQIHKIDGEVATTIFKRFEYAKEFLRSLVRRGSSLISFIADVKTKDGYIFRIKIVALTQKKLNTSRKHAIRLVAQDVMLKTIPEMTIDQFIQATVFGKINSDIMAAVKKIVHVRHVGIEKAKLIRTAEGEIALLQA
ncbi:MAG: 30S ribosomal protein S3ae, partial [Nitrosotalea sp.]